MPKSQQHWGYDLCAALAVLAVAGLVFWLVPAPAEAGQRMSADDAAPIHSTAKARLRCKDATS
jgi:hypothetical protein